MPACPVGRYSKQSIFRVIPAKAGIQIRGFRVVARNDRGDGSLPAGRAAEGLYPEYAERVAITNQTTI